jgi:hypothetical protein
VADLLRQSEALMISKGILKHSTITICHSHGAESGFAAALSWHPHNCFMEVVTDNNDTQWLINVNCFPTASTHTAGISLIFYFSTATESQRSATNCHTDSAPRTDLT